MHTFMRVTLTFTPPQLQLLKRMSYFSLVLLPLLFLVDLDGDPGPDTGEPGSCRSDWSVFFPPLFILSAALAMMLIVLSLKARALCSGHPMTSAIASSESRISFEVLHTRSRRSDSTCLSGFVKVKTSRRSLTLAERCEARARSRSPGRGSSARLFDILLCSRVICVSIGDGSLALVKGGVGK